MSTNNDEVTIIGKGNRKVKVCKHILAAIYAVFKGDPKSAENLFLFHFYDIAGCIHHWADFVLWLKTDKWLNTEVSVACEFERRIGELERERQRQIPEFGNGVRSRIVGCNYMLKLVRRCALSNCVVAEAADADAAAAPATAAAAAPATAVARDSGPIGSKLWDAKD